MKFISYTSCKFQQRLRSNVNSRAILKQWTKSTLSQCTSSCHSREASFTKHRLCSKCCSPST